MSLGVAILELRTDAANFMSGLDKAESRGVGFGDVFKKIGERLGVFGGGADSAGRSMLGLGRSTNDGAKQAGNALNGLGGLAVKAGGMLAGAFAVTKLAGVASDVVTLSGHLTDLAGKTGITTTGLQKMALAVESDGVSMDTVAANSVKLSKALIDGDKSTVGALQKMGVSVADLKKMAPEDQFFTVADAVGKIQNPTEKAWAAMQVFGRGGAELLPSLNGHLKETSEKFEAMGLVLSEDTVAAADDFGDALGLMGKQLLAIVATVIGPLLPAVTALGNVLMWVGRNVVQPVLNVAIKAAITFLAAFWQVLSDVLGRLAGLGAKLPFVGEKFGEMSAWLKDSSKSTGEYMTALWDGTEKTADAAKKGAPAMVGFGKVTDDAGKSAKKAADEHEKLIEKINEVTRVGYTSGAAMRIMVSELENIGEKVDDIDRLKAKFDDFGAMIRSSALTVGKIVIPVTLGIEGWEAGANLPKNVLESGQFGQFLMTMPKQASDSGLKAGRSFMQGFSDTMREGFGSAMNDLNDVFTRAFEGGGDIAGAVKSLATTLVESLTSAIPIVGPILSKFSGAIVAGFSRLFGGPSSKELEGRSVEAQFEQSFGGFDKMMKRIGEAYALTGRSAQQAQADVKALMDAERQGGAAVQAVIDRIQGHLDEAAAANNEVVQTTGRNLEGLKSQFVAMNQELDDMVSQRMSLAQSVAGEAQEETMGVVEAGIRAQMENLDREIADQQDTIQRAAEAAGMSLEEMFRALEIDPVKVPIEWQVPPIPGIGGAGLPVHPQAEGGFGRVTRPTLFLAGEAGPEYFGFSNRGYGMGGGSDSGDVVLNVDGAQLMRASIRHLRQAAKDMRVIV